MSKFAKPILIAATVLVALLGLLVLGANIYLQSSSVQERIRAAVSEAAGMPVTIRSTSFTPWSGLVVAGLIVPNDGSGRQPLLDIASVRVKWSLWSLFGGQFAVEEVIVRGPVLNAYQLPNGSWSRPPRNMPVAPSLPSPPSAEITLEPTSPSAPVSHVPPAPERRGPAIALEKLSVQDGTAYFDDANGRRIANLKGVDVTVHANDDGSFSGKFGIAEAEFLGRIVPRNVRGSFRWSDGTLAITTFEAAWGHGRLTGTAEILSGADASFEAKFEVADALLSELAVDAGWGSDSTKGRLIGHAELRGNTGRPETFAGKGTFELKEAAFVPVDFVRQIGELMAIQELQLLRLKTAVADFSVADAKVSADRLVLESENLIVEVNGPAGFDGSLDLDAKLHLNDRLRRDLRALIGDKLKPSHQQGYAFIPFNITGTINQPRSDLLDKIAGARLGRDVGNLLKSLIRAAPSPSRPPQPRESGN